MFLATAQGYNSEEISIREDEIFNIELLDANSSKQTKRKPLNERRNYSPQFIWGQLISWFKQTVANPHASLSQDRRGTLSFPIMKSSFDTTDNMWPFQTKQDVTEYCLFLVNTHASDTLRPIKMAMSCSQRASVREPDRKGGYESMRC